MSSSKGLLLLVLTVFICETVQSQNLILNGSFENYIKCPDKKGSLVSNTESFKAPTSGSTDYFNTCGKQEVSIPKNFIGEQDAYDGDGYAGLYLFSPNNYREYIQFKIEEPLEAGKTYKAAIRLSLAENSTLAVHDLSVLFTGQNINIDTNENLAPMRLERFNINKYSYQKLEIKKSFTNNQEWGLLEVEFEAKGYEKYMTFGNFKNDRQTKYVRLDIRKNAQKPISFYYIDGVSLERAKNNKYELNKPFVLNRLHFKFDSFELKADAKRDIQKVYRHLKNNPNIKLEIYGHTDNRGGKIYNKYLSSRRARAVAKYLESLGLPENRIVWEGKGDRNPLYKSDSDKARGANRRVEFVITKFDDEDDN